MENRAPKEKTVILIAAYNEEKDIAGVVSGSKKYAGHILVVDDGSEDGTLKEAAEAGATVIRHQRRQGKGAAIKSGLQYIIKNFGDFEVVITLDGDGQHCPADIKKILSARASNKSGLLIGARNYGRMPFGRRFWNGFISFLISRIIGQKIGDSQSGFRLLGRRLALILAESSGRDDYCIESEIIFLAIKNKIKMAETGVGTVYKKKFSLKTLRKDLIRSGQIFIFVIRRSFDFYPRFKLFLKIILTGLFFISFPHLILTDLLQLLKNSSTILDRCIP